MSPRPSWPSASKALDLAVAGPRKEDIAQAEAQLRGRRGATGAAAAAARGRPADRAARCRRALAPDGAGRDGLAAEGRCSRSPSPIRSGCAPTSPRPDLGTVRPGMRATVDGRQLPGAAASRAGSASSPRSPNSRPRPCRPRSCAPSLVYEVRVFVKDPDDELRLGMPATVHLPLTASPPDATP